MFTISATPPVDPFTESSIVIRTRHSFDYPVADVFAAIDSDDAWRWLAPTCGVTYLEPGPDGAARGVGVVREMGSVRNPLRWVWRQREVFTEYETNRGFAYYATHGSWPLLRSWAEEYRFEPTSENSCTLTWTVALTPVIVGRLPLHWTEPPLRWAFTLGFRPGLRRLVRRRAAD